MNSDFEPIPGLSETAAAADARPGLWERLRHSSLVRVVLYVVVFALLAVALSFVVKGAFHLAHFHTKDHAALGGALGEGMTAFSAVFAFWVMVRFIDRRPWATAGFTRRALLPQIGLGFALGAGLLSVSVGVLGLLGVYHMTGHNAHVLLLLPLFTYLCVGVFEETFFRGYLFQTLEGRWGSGVALTATAVVFGLAHSANPVHGVAGWQRMAGPVFICLEAGLPLGAAYLLTRRWWLSIGIHWAWDFCEGPVWGVPDSGTIDPNTLLRAHLSGPVLLSGGPFGPEAGVILLATGALLGIALLRLAVRNGEWRPKPPKVCPVVPAH